MRRVAFLGVLSLLLILGCTKAPVADFTASVTSGPAPFAVKFTDTSQNGPNAWSWDFADGGTSAEQNPTHQYTRAGTFAVALTVSNKAGSHSVTKTGLITVKPGTLARLELSPQEVVLSIGVSQAFLAVPYDQFNNPSSELRLSFKADSQAGTVDDKGNFKAGTKAGTYDAALTVKVSQNGVERAATAKVTVKPDPLDSVTITPASASVNIGKTEQYQAQAFDRHGNPIPGLSYTFKADPQAGAVDDKGNFKAGTKAGSFAQAVTVEVTQAGVTKSATAEVAIKPDPLSSLAITPSKVTLDIGKSQQFQGQALDQYQNPIPGLAYSFKADAIAGAVDDKGSFKAGTKAGTFPQAVTVEVTQAGVTKSATVEAAIKPDPLSSVVITPSKATLSIGKPQQFQAGAFDQYGNRLWDVTISWRDQEGIGDITPGISSITPDAIFTAGTKAGTFPEGVVLQGTQGNITKSAKAEVAIKPDPLASVTIPSVKAGAGETRKIEAIATDKYGNPLGKDDGVATAFTIRDSNAGSSPSEELFKAGEVAGIFPDAVEGRATQGEITRSATASVTIAPGPLAGVFLAPTTTNIGMGMTQQFVAVGADRFGNRISGLTFTWKVEAGGGAIDDKGVFTAGDKPGTYSKTVKVTATQGDITASAAADVVVEPDRIAFISDRNDTQRDVYLMNSDGAKVQRLTNTSEGEYYLSWSPDGRRIAYETVTGILAMNDDGSWKLALLDWELTQSFIRERVEPAWSPDGSKIAFVNAEIPVLADGTLDTQSVKRDIFVMDIDGGDIKGLTDTPDGDEWVPAWSPDGSRIVYDFTPWGGNGDIWIMNADGSNKRQLTTHPANDTAPSFSPDGREILFSSDRDGDSELYVMNSDGTSIRQLTSNSASDLGTAGSSAWSPDGKRILLFSYRDGNYEVYVMNADGTSQTRLTNNSARDLYPTWAPRKRGVQVSEASVVISNTSTLKPMTGQEVTARARAGVVRIQTDLASGSGFIIDPNGLILTANHVIVDAKEITVYLEDGRSFKGTVKGRDLARDLAVVQIEARNLPSLELGDMSYLPLGAEVLVLGYPLGSKDLNITKGVASAFKYDAGRNILWVQTDAAVNPGNSGGPMLNLQGQVVGMVTAKIVGAGVEGVGFAVSVSTVKVYLPRVTAGGVLSAASLPIPLKQARLEEDRPYFFFKYALSLPKLGWVA